MIRCVGTAHAFGNDAPAHRNNAGYSRAIPSRAQRGQALEQQDITSHFHFLPQPPEPATSAIHTLSPPIRSPTAPNSHNARHHHTPEHQQQNAMQQDAARELQGVQGYVP